MGYYSRARNLHRAAQQVVALYGGIIPQELNTFRKLPGVGPYIAAAVLSIAAGIPLAAIDGNVMRVYTRFHGLSDDISRTNTRQKITAALQNCIPPESASNFTQAFMELGALICTPKNPQCPTCPINKNCTAFQTNTITLYPFKPAKPKVPTYQVAVAVIVDKDHFYIQKRPSSGHLGGLWEFPGGKAEPGETPSETLIRECYEELGIAVDILQPLAIVHHAYSHFKICLHVYLCQWKEKKPLPSTEIEYRWITIHQLNDYPFPGANHKFFPQLREYFHPKPCE